MKTMSGIYLIGISAQRVSNKSHGHGGGVYIFGHCLGNCSSWGVF